jgi:hypothetical protein
MTVSSVLLANAVPCRMPGYRGSSALPFPQQVTGRVVACWRQQTMWSPHFDRTGGVT